MLVSVITPLYNSESWLESSVKSLQAQTYQNWEMLIVDDFSSDSSLTLAQHLATSDSRIKVYKLAENSGASVARNVAIEVAKGHFIAFLDSDDLWHPKKLEVQLNFMQKKDIAFSFTAYEKINETGSVFEQIGVPLKVSYYDLLKTNVIGCLTVIYNVEKLGKVYMPVNTKREDFAAWLQILKKVDYAFGINEPLAQYRVYKGQSSAKKVKMAKENWRLYSDLENLNIIQASYYFSHYVVRGVLRAKFPKVARFLGVLK